MKKITYIDLHSQNPKTYLNAELDEFPDLCPICHKGQEPRLITAYLKPPGTLEVIFKCYRNTCSSMFIASYVSYGGGQFFLANLSPQHFVRQECNETIKNISPQFEEIYNQSKAAETYSLNLIAGMGYRKALEFLIKDYLINHKKDNKEEIEGKFLGKCINEYIENPKIKELAKKTAYLGNDETHYVKKYEDKDIKDLKRLLDLTLHWIICDIETDKALLEDL